VRELFKKEGLTNPKLAYPNGDIPADDLTIEEFSKTKAAMLKEPSKYKKTKYNY
jgi:hypothetical protein